MAQGDAVGARLAKEACAGTEAVSQRLTEAVVEFIGEVFTPEVQGGGPAIEIEYQAGIDHVERVALESLGVIRVCKITAPGTHRELLTHGTAVGAR